MAGIAPAQDPPAPAPGEPSPAQPIPQTVPAEQLEAVQAELEVVTAQLVEAYRRLFLSLAEADRSAFLADMMSRGLADDAEQQDERAPLPVKVRELAYDLATAEVVSARPLGPALIDAASLGLADRQPEIRAKAAGLLAKLDASAVIERVRAALASETHTGAATQMLSVVARHPEAASQPVVLAWLKKPDLPIAVRLAALDAVLSHQRDFALTDPESLALVSATIDGLSPDEYTANTVRLLMAIGSTERVRELLGAEREVIAAAAASQLVDDAASLDAMLARAAEEPAIFAFAVEAVRRHQPTATGFRRASELPAPSPEKRAEVLTELASSLQPSELLTVASLPMDLAERERYLSTVAAPEELQRFVDPEHRTEDRRLLLESLVRTRLQLKNAAGALRVIQGLPAEAKSATLAQDEVAALIWLNRLDEAIAGSESLGNPIAPEVWLATLEKIEATDHAPEALARFVDAYSGSLTESQTARLNALSERVASLHPTPPPAEPEGVANEEDAADEADVVDSDATASPDESEPLR